MDDDCPEKKKSSALRGMEELSHKLARTPHRSASHRASNQFFFHSSSPKLYETLIEDYKVQRGILHLTAGDGELAMAAYRKRVPYVGLTLTTAHKTALYDRLVRAVLNSMGTEGAHDYDAAYAAALQGKKVKKTQQRNNPKKDTPPNPLEAGEEEDDEENEGEEEEDEGGDGDDEDGGNKLKPSAKAKGGARQSTRRKRPRVDDEEEDE